MKKHYRNKGLFFVCWLILIIAFWITWIIGDFRLVDVFDTLISRPFLAFIVLLIGYSIRPFLLLPTTIMNIFSGHLFGIWFGFLFASIAVIGSSIMGYIIGRFFSTESVVKDVMLKYPMIRKLSRKSFLVVLISRLMYLPSDLINIPAGFLKIKIFNLISGTILGSSLIIFFAVSFGASVEGNLKDVSFSIDVKLLGISLICVCISLVTSWILRKHFMDEGLE